MTESNSLVLRLGAIVVLVLANAFFVAAEFALVATRRTRIDAMIRKGDKKAKTVRAALNDLNRQLSAAQLGITVASILLGYVAEEALGNLFHDWLSGLPAALNFATRAGFAATLAVSVVSVLHVVIGEQAPKTWAITYPEATSRWIAGPLYAFSWITRPATGSLNWAAEKVVRLMGIKTEVREHDRVHSPEEIRMVIEQSQRAGQMGKGDARLLAGVFEFSEKNAREVMTPRTQMIALHEGDTLAEAADQIAGAGRSRYPVYRESLDDITGLVYAKDVLAALRKEGPPAAFATLLRAAHFVPGSREVEDVLADMKMKKVHMVIVLDEFGGTAGLVTMEDLLEEIVGQIEDEYDRPSGAFSTKAGAPGSAVFAGDMHLSEVNERCGVQLVSEDYSTLSGYLFGALGRLPHSGDVIKVKGGSFEVTAMDGKRIAEAKFVKAQS
jgi:CBS domain containing-hemolysin-like protein